MLRKFPVFLSLLFALALVFCLLFFPLSAVAEHPSLQDARSLYIDLMLICGEPKFERHGVSLDGPYAPWRERFNDLAANAAAAAAFRESTDRTYADLLVLANTLKNAKGRLTEEILELAAPIEMGLQTPSSAYLPGPEMLALVGAKMDYNLEDAYGPIVPLMEGQGYWLIYLQGADVSLVLKQGVIQRVLKGKRGRMSYTRTQLEDE